MSDETRQHPATKYRPFPAVGLHDRSCPEQIIDRPPVWCSVDLRDGNQALIEPMGLERKLRMFKALIDIGFKEIEIGFPAASQTDYDFCRHIIDNDMVPRDVTVQVLSQCRDELIERSFEALEGIHRAIVHIYNSTSTLQRRVVFGLDEQGIIDIAVKGTQMVKDMSDKIRDVTKVTFQYSPESFTGTELPFAVQIVEAVQLAARRLRESAAETAAESVA